MVDPNLEPRGDVTFAPAPQPLTVSYGTRRIVMLYVAEHELDMVASLSSSIHLTFFGICVGVLGSFAGVMLGGQIADPVKHATCVALILVSGLGALFFGICGIKAYVTATQKLRELKKNP